MVSAPDTGLVRLETVYLLKGTAIYRNGSAVFKPSDMSTAKPSFLLSILNHRINHIVRSINNIVKTDF